MSNVVFDGLLMTAEQLLRVVGDPCTKGRLWFREVGINRWEEEMFIAWKDTVTKFI